MKIFGISGWSGSGKTTLIEQLVPRFVARGMSVSLIKHAHHKFDVDHPGKDSYRHRQAGCREVMVSSDARWVIMHELRGDPEPSLEDQIRRISPCDLLLVEGYKRYAIPKMEVWRKDNAKPLLYPEDQHVVAVASDAALETVLPRFDLSDYDGIGNFILAFNGLK
jgi:molybdopterin-guanine dinucleotide biosynthesis protein B